MAAQSTNSGEKVKIIFGKTCATIPFGRSSAQGTITAISGDGKVTIDAGGRMVTGSPITPVNQMVA